VLAESAQPAPKPHRLGRFRAILGFGHRVSKYTNPTSSATESRSQHVFLRVSSLWFMIRVRPSKALRSLDELEKPAFRGFTDGEARPGPHAFAGLQVAAEQREIDRVMALRLVGHGDGETVVSRCREDRGETGLRVVAYPERPFQWGHDRPVHGIWLELPSTVQDERHDFLAAREHEPIPERRHGREQRRLAARVRAFLDERERVGECFIEIRRQENLEPAQLGLRSTIVSRSSMAGPRQR